MDRLSNFFQSVLIYILDGLKMKKKLILGWTPHKSQCRVSYAQNEGIPILPILQWMGAVRMKVQTADKNITVIHTTPVHPLTY